MSKVLIVHGVADRDPDELVCQMFPATKKGLAHMGAFLKILPGQYRIQIWKGISYRRARCVSIGKRDREVT